MQLNDLLQFNFMSVPTLFVEHLSPTEKMLAEEALLKAYESFAQQNYDIHPDLLLKSSFYPDVVEKFLVKLPIEHPTVTGLAMANIDVSFRVLTENYNTPLGEKIELTILSHPDAVLELQEWAFATKQTLRYSLDVYTPAIYQSLLTAWRFVLRFSPTDESEFFSVMQEAHRIYGMKNTHEGALLRLIQTGNDSQQVRSMLAEHPRTAIIGATLLKDTELLTRWLQYPQWAYHALKYVGAHMTPNQTQMAFQALVRILPWAYQYLAESGLKDTDPITYNSHMAIAKNKWKNLFETS